MLSMELVFFLYLVYFQLRNDLLFRTSCAECCLLNTLCLASRGVPAQSFGYGYTPVPGGYAPAPFPGGYASAPGGYAPPPYSGPYAYVPVQMNGYGPAPQPMGYPYMPPQGENVCQS